MTATTIPAPQSLQEARHWVLLESYFGTEPDTARKVLDYVEGRATLTESAEQWLAMRVADREVGIWCQKILGGAS